MGKLPIDLRTSTQWALASVNTKGVVGLNATVFDLVNVVTGRAHRLNVRAGGIDVGFPVTYSPSSSMSNYTYFSTHHPVNFDDFDGVGARMISGSGLVYSWCSLTLWEGPAYISKGLAWVRMSGWGLSTPGAGVHNGVASVAYGDGKPVGVVETVAEIDMPVTELVNDGIKITSKDEKIVFLIPGDILFDFNKDNLKPGADPTLKRMGVVIASIPNRRKVYFNGYTDSIGTDVYNKDLSQRRANKVSEWFVSHAYVPRTETDPTGYGKTGPVAPNKRPDGSDNPDGRAKNRRVEIVVLRRAA